MITTTWTSAPAGFPSAGGSHLRYGRCAAAVFEVQGTGLPAAGVVARDVRLVGGGVVVSGTALLADTALPLGTQMTTRQKFGITNGTTLGNLAPGRPTS
jgi:hypothetical protein